MNTVNDRRNRKTWQLAIKCMFRSAQKLVAVVLMAGAWVFPTLAQAQSPELSMREFSSGQIKKGVRSIGFGGDGASWGNYALVWKDADTALVDYGDTHYTNGNDFHFSAVGATTPPLWHHMAIYVIAMFQNGNDVHINVRSPGLGPAPVSVTGNGSDHAIFSKIAMPLGRGVSLGVLLSHETSQFNATSIANPLETVRYRTSWRPSGGFGVSWQPDKKMIFGFRGLLNNDLEHRTDPAGTTQGMARSAEFRLGAAFAPWQGVQLDAGGTRLERRNAINGTHTLVYHPNLGVEQALFKSRLTLRGGVDETSPTAGLTVTIARFKLDSAYVDNMARGRVGNLFGTHSNSLLFTLTYDYGRKKASHVQAPSKAAAQMSSDSLLDATI